MFVVTPLMAAILLGSTFWTGVAATSVASHHGFGVGASADVSATADNSDACAARYHSYNSNPDYPDQWLGRDGRWHVCTL